MRRRVWRGGVLVVALLVSGERCGGDGATRRGCSLVKKFEGANRCSATDYGIVDA